MANIMTLALDPETRDLMFDADGMLQCVYDGEAIAQNIRNNLHTWKGEFPLNTAHGTDWERVVGRPKSEAEDEADDVVREIESLAITADGRSIGADFSGILYDGSTIRVGVNTDG